MTVDLTTFNGLMTRQQRTVRPTNVAPLPVALNGYHFEAHQRGEKNYLPACHHVGRK